jgi:hypothetical protein
MGRRNVGVQTGGHREGFHRRRLREDQILRVSTHDDVDEI